MHTTHQQVMEADQVVTSLVMVCEHQVTPDMM